MGMFKSLTDAWHEWKAIRCSKKCAELSAEQRLEEAYEAGREGLEIMEKTFGDIFQTSVHTYNLAEICLKLGREREASEYIARSEKIAKRHTENLLDRPSGDADLAEAVTAVARIMLLKNVGADLPQFLGRVFEARIERVGEADRLLRQSLLAQADVEFQLGRFAEAEALYASLAALLETQEEDENEEMEIARRGVEASRKAMQQRI